mmetsp:Transcript_17698/g.17904  ORF Transcript_17698/g.17904 Transcript_17698/m.17904 type:complete len:89 (+) Transcript_17698:51-317(+)
MNVYDAGTRDGDDNGGNGYLSIICLLLKLCDIDELVENEEPPPQTSTKKTMADVEKSRDQICNELESHPATLGKSLCNAPHFQKLYNR